MKNVLLRGRFEEGRKLEALEPGMPKSTIPEGEFDLVKLLSGSTWKSADRGWNLIALPFRDPSAPFNYRVLMNQYGETLRFVTADQNIPNRGITPDGSGDTDQLLDALDYEQMIAQVAAADFPSSNLRSVNGKGIHHEPGLFLQLLNHATQHGDALLNIARLATIPHGDSVLAMGKVRVINGPANIPVANALPQRVNQDLSTNPYLGPYKHFVDQPFLGSVTAPGFPGFEPRDANHILRLAQPNNVAKTTILHFDTEFPKGAIVNIPFVVREANAAEMQATFWIMELTQADPTAPKQFVMQYSQTVMLDFFDSRDFPGQKIRWPHVSINTLSRIA